jgi:predicted unusual protein kinase regulating ubiquinone biosynthesis (AarF/ABC1/UbiB family)
VAVKVRYEGIAKAVESDLQLASLGRWLGPINRKLALGDQLDEMRERFSEELDYRHEARAQADFAALFEGDPSIRIPYVVPELCARRVLTQQLAPGLRFDEACRRTESERRAWAVCLWRFVFESLLQGLFNADPHPGNYLFDEERVWFLDYGCTKRLPDELVQRIRATHRAAAALDRAGFLEAGRRSVGAPRSADHARRMDEYLLLCFDPLLTPGPYRITRAYARKLLEDMRANFLVLLKGASEDYAPLPPDFLFLNRLQLGFYSVLARLDVEVDYHAVELDLVEKICAA